jgi:23S rRNA (uracil1939-C5)-methyltransferase
MNSFSCPIFPKCPGCKSQKNVLSPPILDELNAFFLNLAIPFDLFSEKIVAWRSKAKLAVRGSRDYPEIGLFEEGSHQVVPMKSCPLHYPKMDEALAIIYQEMVQFGIEPYQETGTGRLRYIQLFFQKKTERVQLSLVINGESLEEKEQEFIEKISTYPIWHSIWVNFHPNLSNTIFGQKWELIFGEEDFYQEMGGISFSFHPASFSQAHLVLFEEILKQVANWIPKGSFLVDLYSGVGCFGVYLAAQCSKVLLIESSPHSLSCFELTRSRLPLDIQEKCLFLQESVEKSEIPIEAEIILVDPPRKGLSKSCKEKINTSKANQLIYVSCGPQSFMRDCLELVESGWLIEKAQGFLLFPGSNHVEIAATFKRAV